MHIKCLTPITRPCCLTTSKSTFRASSKIALPESGCNWRNSPKTIYTPQSALLPQFNFVVSGPKGDL